MALDLPGKLLQATALTQTGVTRWPHDDGKGDKWWSGGSNPRFYTWDMDITVTTQSHSSHLTRDPFTFDAFDIKPGDWVSTPTTGKALRIIGVTSKTSTSATIRVEDVNRYNTFRDTSEQGDGSLGTGSLLIFQLNEEGEPLVDTIPTNLVGPAYFPNLMSRFQNLNSEYDFNLTEVGHTFAVGDLISADPDNNQWVKATSVYNMTIGRISELGPSPDQFYITPIQKIINNLDELPGNKASILYIDEASPGGVTDVANDNIIYIKLHDETPTSLLSAVSPISTTAGNVISINGQDITFTIGDQADVVSGINAVQGTTGVTASTESAPTTANSVGPYSWGSVLAYGDGAGNNPMQANITIGALGVGTLYPVNFDIWASGHPVYTFNAADAVDMAAALNRDVADPDFNAYSIGGLLYIEHTNGAEINITNVTPGSFGAPFAGSPAPSASGLPFNIPASTDAFLRVTGTSAGPIEIANVTGTPQEDLGLYTVENGTKAAALYVEKGLSGGGASSEVVADIAGRDALSPATGDQAMVLDRGNGEWELYLYDGGAWVAIANQDSARTDANSIEFTLDFNSPASNTMLTVSDESRITLITIEVLTPFDGAPILTIGDGIDAASLLSDDLHDLSGLGTYASQTDTYYNPGNDTDIIATYTPGGATQGQAKIIVSYM